ncbi:ATP-binding protein [Arthrobacter tecti]
MEGRGAETETFAVLLQRAKHGLHNRGMVLSGLRGVGKTVLLNHFRASAEGAGWVTVYLEGKTSAAGQESLRSRLARELVTAARRLNNHRWVSVGKMPSKRSHLLASASGSQA